MPILDVTRVLLNPRFNDFTLTYTRREILIDDDGITSTKESTFPFSGVVTVDSSIEAQIRTSGQLVSGRILVVTTTRLIAGETHYIGDIVTYQERKYLVKSVDPYTAYGARFLQAHCELMPFDGGISHEHSSAKIGWLTPFDENAQYNESLNRRLSLWVVGVSGLPAKHVTPLATRSGTVVTA